MRSSFVSGCAPIVIKVQRMTSDKFKIFNAQRPRLMAHAYRLLGSHSDAEDILQEAWIRWQTQILESIETPEAFLTTIVTSTNNA